MRIVLPFKLEGQTLVKQRGFPKSVADGSKDSIVIKADGVPEGCIAKGYFRLSWENNTLYDLTFDGDELVVSEYITTLPKNATNEYIDYKFSFSLAIWDGNEERLTTNPVEVIVEKSNYSEETTNTPDIPKSQYDSFVEEISAFSYESKQARNEAVLAKNETLKFASSVSADAEEAKEAAEKAKEAADRAEETAGTAGVTPHIGENGNWYIGDTDTNVKATGDPGADGKSAYEYAQDGGYTGTEEEFAEKLATKIPDALPNPYPLTINGKAYNGSEAVDVMITGGTAGGNISLGQTPVTLAQSASIKLVGEGEHSYTIKGKTIADLSTISVSEKKNVEITEYEDYIELSSTSTATEWYNAYATLSVNGLTVGTKYILGVVKTETVSIDNKIPSLYIIVKNSSGTTIGTMNGELTGLNTLEFTPDTTDVTLYWYVASNYYWVNAGCRSTKIGDLYINKSEDGAERTDIIDKTGNFTDAYSLGQLSKGITITSEPSCEVYNVSNESESGGVSAPLAGKTVVCFGDSLFGMYTGDTSAPAFVAQKTGATVHNVGFSGCRMSVHPYVGYNEFCMYALATAIASGDWSLQDAAASEGSENFPDQLAILKSIDFSVVDYIVIHYGTNDFNGVSIDNTSNLKDYNTLCGALRYSIETLLGAFPKLKIFVSLPAFRYWTADDGTVTYSDTWKNVNGHTLPDFVKALADTAKEYKLPVIDCYYGMGINKSNAATFLADGTHHNIDGRKLFGEYIGAKLISYGDTFRGTDSETGGGIDVTASVGQTIVVKEVDADGKPTKWEAAEYQPRTHYSEFVEKELLAETVVEFSDETEGMVILDGVFSIGDTYTVMWDGTEYTGEITFIGGMAVGGNLSFFDENLTGYTEPFGLAEMDGMAIMMVMDAENFPYTVTTSVKIATEVVQMIPKKYVPTNTYLITDVDYTTGIVNESYDNFSDVLWNGGTVYVRNHNDDEASLINTVVSAMFTGVGWTLYSFEGSNALKIFIASNGTWTPPNA